MYKDYKYTLWLSFILIISCGKLLSNTKQHFPIDGHCQIINLNLDVKT